MKHLQYTRKFLIVNCSIPGRPRPAGVAFLVASWYTRSMCEMCGGPGVPSGRLGDLFWFRCRNCGIEFTGEENVEFEDEDRYYQTDGLD